MVEKTTLELLTEKVTNFCQTCSVNRKDCAKDHKKDRDDLHIRIDETHSRINTRVSMVLFLSLMALLVTVCGFFYHGQNKAADVQTEMRIKMADMHGDLRVVSQALAGHVPGMESIGPIKFGHGHSKRD